MFGCKPLIKLDFSINQINAELRILVTGGAPVNTAEGMSCGLLC